MTSPEKSRVTVVAGPPAAAALAPLLEAWQHSHVVRLERGGPPDPVALAAIASRSDAVLVVGPRNRSPRTVLPGPVLRTREGRGVPVAWLPDTGADAVRTFARAAARVHARAQAWQPPAHRTRTFAVLGERQPRFDRLADRILGLAREDRSGGLAPTRWTAYEVDRDELVRRLGRGPGLAVYVGHGRPVGWVGYAGLRAHHLVAAEPAGAVLSLTCKTASRRRTGLSFAESLPLRGVAAAAVGAVGVTSHPANARWALRITRAAPGAATIGDLLVAVTRNDPAAAAYRLLGDPTAPLLDPLDGPVAAEAS